jgi:hypothetical protein
VEERRQPWHNKGYRKDEVQWEKGRRKVMTVMGGGANLKQGFGN